MYLFKFLETITEKEALSVQNNILPDESLPLKNQVNNISHVNTKIVPESLERVNKNTGNNTKINIIDSSTAEVYSLFSKNAYSLLAFYKGEQTTFILEGLNKGYAPEGKQINAFINEKIKKQIIFIEILNKEEKNVIVYLDKEKTQNLNQMVLDKFPLIKNNNDLPNEKIKTVATLENLTPNPIEKEIKEEPVSAKLVTKSSLEGVYGLFSKDGQSFLCMHNNDKPEYKLSGIDHPDKNAPLSKRANTFINQYVKKTRVFIDKQDDGSVIVYLDKDKKQNLNQMMVEEGLDKSIANYQTNSVEATVPETNLTEKTSTPTNEEKLANNTLGEAVYCLFSKDAESFLAMHNDTKKTFKLDGINHEDKKSSVAKKANAFINEKIKQKRIFLEIVGEELGDNARDIVVVYLDKEKTQNLNQMMIENNLHIDTKVTKTNEKVIETTDISNNYHEDYQSHSDMPPFEDIPLNAYDDIYQNSPDDGFFQSDNNFSNDDPFNDGFYHDSEHSNHVSPVSLSKEKEVTTETKSEFLTDNNILDETPQITKKLKFGKK